MSTYKNKSITSLMKSPEGNGDLSVDKIPMDLNYSPIEDYLNQLVSINSNTTEVAAAPPLPTSNNGGRTMPVLIPNSPTSSNRTLEVKKHHKRRRRKPLANTVPDNGLEAVLERRFKQSHELMSAMQTSRSGKSSQTFFVGSLQEKVPVPWPTNLTLAPDTNRHRLTNRQTVNWPLVPENSHQYMESFEDEDDIFSMDDD